jgi:hypothetical protein
VTITRNHPFIASALATVLLASTAHAQPPVGVPLDSETTVAGIGVGCTGIGQTRTQPRWLAYPVRLEFADARHEYVAGEVVTVSETGGAERLRVRCEGPWLLLKLPAGRSFKVEARLTEKTTAPRGAVVTAPKHGQTRFVLTFPDAD